jgi:transcriptional regulator with PAS, ATPase and Fis domain
MALDRAIYVALQVAPTDASVLITGESGVGKEFFPQIIHNNSLRKHGEYIAVNCGAIPEGTIDSELFGHEKGSFTGALAERKGYFEVVNSGTIFLDEVGELPVPTQARLLRVLETGEFMRVGSSKVFKTNVRVVAATNVDLMNAVLKGKFREDLFYRLSSIPIQIPPLRERGEEDILLLFRKFATDCAEKYKMPSVIKLDESAKKVLVSYRWPGNVRELKNVTERISVIEERRNISGDILKYYLPKKEIENFPMLLRETENGKIFGSEREILYQVLFDMKKDVAELKTLVHDIMSGSVRVDGGINYSNMDHGKSIQEVVDVIEEETVSLADAEREAIRKMLDKFGGKRKKAAEELGISERTLYRKIREYGLE